MEKIYTAFFEEASPTLRFALEFLPAASLCQIDTDRFTASVYKDPQTGTWYFVRTQGTTSVNSDLNGDERQFFKKEYASKP